MRISDWSSDVCSSDVDGANVQFSAGGRVGAKIGANGKLYATGGYTFGDVDDPYVGAGYQHKLTQNVYAKGEYRHQFIDNFGDFDTFVAGKIRRASCRERVCQYV